MALKHKVSIHIAGTGGRNEKVLAGAVCRISNRLLHFFFGDFTQVYFLSPGQSVESVEICEVKEGGNMHGKS